MSGKVGYELSGRHLVDRVEESYSTRPLPDALASGLEALEPELRALVLIDARASTFAGEVGAYSEVFRDLSEARTYLDHPPDG